MCFPDCPSCYFRGLNHVWGCDLRPIDLGALEAKLVNGLKNTNPRSSLAKCLAQKKTIRLGNKTDPFQPIEEEMRRSTGAIRIMTNLQWSYVVQTKFPTRMWAMNQRTIRRAARQHLVTLLPIISPGMELDWELMEGGNTEPIATRLSTIQEWGQQDIEIPFGVNGEPFIPGFHTVAMFEDAIRRLKAVGVKRYNTYNFHFTPHVAKRLVKIKGVDIEKIWNENHDANWKKILVQLLDIAKRYDMILGCPDFVNPGPDYRECANTCCGIDVPNPCTFNTHYFKKYAQDGLTAQQIIDVTNDGSGDYEEGRGVIIGSCKGMYTLKDSGLTVTDDTLYNKNVDNNGGLLNE